MHSIGRVDLHNFYFESDVAMKVGAKLIARADPLEGTITYKVVRRNRNSWTPVSVERQDSLDEALAAFNAID